jgi:uncharacterized protein YjbI with pentapeptide repeats
LSGIIVPRDLWYELTAKLGGPSQHLTASIIAPGAVFPFLIRHDGWTFRNLSLTGATLEGGAEFRECTFSDSLDLSYVDYANAPTTFWDCTFTGVTGAYGQGDKQHVAFTSCEIKGNASFSGFVGDLRFDQCRISGNLDVNQGHFKHLSLQSLQLSGQLSSRDLEGGGWVRMSGAVLETATSIGPATLDAYDFSGTTFRSRVQIFLTSGRAAFCNAIWEHGGRLEVEDAQLDLASVVLGGPLALIGKGTANLVSIQDADAGAMSVSTMDMSRCIFRGAHRLSDMSVDSTVTLSRAPRFRARRRCVADEFGWRARHARWRRRDWTIPGTYLETPKHGADGVVLPNLGAAEVAAVYRSLRNGLEGAANQPGAADFYYGEMEMRRLDKRASWDERLVVTLYWLVSGYGLRASRAFLWLTLSILLGALMLHQYGFVSRTVSTSDSVLAAVESAVPGVTVRSQLSDWGRAIDIALTVSGPVFLALAALALRNRIKR